MNATAERQQLKTVTFSRPVGGVKKVHTQECNRPVSSLHTRAKWE